jgi:hypothetical protein
VGMSRLGAGSSSSPSQALSTPTATLRPPNGCAEFQANHFGRLFANMATRTVRTPKDQTIARDPIQRSNSPSMITKDCRLP